MIGIMILASQPGAPRVPRVPPGGFCMDMLSALLPEPPRSVAAAVAHTGAAEVNSSDLLRSNDVTDEPLRERSRARPACRAASAHFVRAAVRRSCPHPCVCGRVY